jgi:hypothetical protein
VISPIGEEGSPSRRRADQVLRHIIEPAVRKTGYARARRADQIASPGIINQQVIEAVADADLVVADLTDHNPNVFYELAIRHGLQGPLVQMIESSQDLPFDIAQMRTIKFDIHDLDSVEEAREALVMQIEDLQANGPVITPISVARDMKAMWESEDPARHILADVLAAISSLQADVQRTSLPTFGEALMPTAPIGALASKPKTMSFEPLKTVPWETFAFHAGFSPEDDEGTKAKPVRPAPKSRPKTRRKRAE